MHGKCIPFSTLFPLRAGFQGSLKPYCGYDSISTARCGQSGPPFSLLLLLFVLLSFHTDLTATPESFRQKSHPIFL